MIIEQGTNLAFRSPACIDGEFIDMEYPQPWRDGCWRLAGDKLVMTEAFAAELAAEARDVAKRDRQAAVDAIKVTVSTGKTFDGDETSQTRMSRAIVGLQAAGVPTITWTLADNTSTEVTVAELTEALILAGQEQTRLWVLP